jgi:hypothetical protein
MSQVKKKLILKVVLFSTCFQLILYKLNKSHHPTYGLFKNKIKNIYYYKLKTIFFRKKDLFPCNNMITQIFETNKFAKILRKIIPLKFIMIKIQGYSYKKFFHNLIKARMIWQQLINFLKLWNKFNHRYLMIKIF